MDSVRVSQYLRRLVGKQTGFMQRRCMDIEPESVSEWQFSESGIESDRFSAAMKVRSDNGNDRERGD